MYDYMDLDHPHINHVEYTDNGVTTRISSYEKHVNNHKSKRNVYVKEERIIGGKPANIK